MIRLKTFCTRPSRCPRGMIRSTATILTFLLALGALATLGCAPPLGGSELPNIDPGSTSELGAAAQSSSGRAKVLLSRPICGMALGLYSQDPRFEYQEMLQEIADTGSNTVSLCLNFYQAKVDSTVIGIPDRRTPSWHRIRMTVRDAHVLGLNVCLFPIVLIQAPGDSDWRGTIKPTDKDEWFSNYEQLIHKIATIAEEEGAAALSVGSEFNSMQTHTQEWRRMITDVRKAYHGALTYSVNWDSLSDPQFYDLLDIVGLTTYFSLTQSNEPTVDELVSKWSSIREGLLEWQSAHGRPMLFTEVGFPSQDGANKDPWNYFTSKTVDLQEQADCYEAFAQVWQGDSRLFGVFFYNWFDSGGETDPGYTPRGKPALEVVKRWNRAAKATTNAATPRAEKESDSPGKQTE